MYEIQFSATNSADWSQAVQLIDDQTGLPFDGASIEFSLEVDDRGGAPVLRGSTTDGVIERPEPSIIQWSFPVSQMRALCAGNTYRVGCTATDEGGTIQLFVGTLSLINGVVS